MALKRLLEQLERFPCSPLIRRLPLICLSAPEERSWSSCFCLPLLVCTFPTEETRDGQSAALVPPTIPPSSTHSSTHVYILIYNEHVCPQSCVSFVAEGEGLAGMTRETYKWLTDLRGHCGSEWSNHPRANFASEINGSSLPGSFVIKWETYEYDHPAWCPSFYFI